MILGVIGERVHIHVLTSGVVFLDPIFVVGGWARLSLWNHRGLEMSIPDIAVINFSALSVHETQEAIRAINRQIMEDFMPIWGSGYRCKLHASPYGPGEVEVIREDPVQAEAVIYFVDEANIASALGYHDLNNSEVPVGFVFTDLGDWTVKFSHEALELIVDPTINILVPGPDPRQPDNPDAWLLHTYEVCDAVERTDYRIDGISVSNFVTPHYFAEGDAPGTRNDFLGVGVDSFGVTPGSHMGTVDPTDFSWVEILGSKYPSRNLSKSRFEQFKRKGKRPRAGPKQEALLMNYRNAPSVEGSHGLPTLTALTRSRRKQRYIEQHRNTLSKKSGG